MNIQVISQYYSPDNFRINDIAAELASKGHAVRVLTGLPDYTTSRVPWEYKFFRRHRDNINNVYVERVPIIARRSGVVFRTLNYGSFAITASVKALFSRISDIDVIFVNQTSPVFQAIPALIYKWRTKKKLVLYCYDLWPESLKAWNISEKTPMYKLVAKISGWIYAHCDVIGITSKPFERYLTDNFCIPESRIVYLPQYAEDDFASIQGKYEDNGCVDFLFAGNIGAVQDIDCILKAASKVKTAQRFCIHIVGDGSELERLKSLVNDLGLSDNIKFYGRHPAEVMLKFYQMADCFLLTLRGGDFIGYTLPGKVQGYLSAGKPILAAIDGAGYELIKESDCGEVVPAGNYDALAQKMAQMIENFDSYKQQGVKGRKFYENNFCKECFIRDLLGLLEG